MDTYILSDINSLAGIVFQIPTEHNLNAWTSRTLDIHKYQNKTRPIYRTIVFCL